MDVFHVIAKTHFAKQQYGEPLIAFSKALSISKETGSKRLEKHLLNDISEARRALNKEGKTNGEIQKN